MFATFPDAYDTSDLTRATRASTLKAELADSRYHRAPRPAFVLVNGIYHQLTDVQPIAHDRHLYVAHTTKNHEVRCKPEQPVLTFPDPPPPTLIIDLEGGLIQNIHRPADARARIIVRDYDTEGAETTTRDPRGRECIESIWEPQS